MAKKFLKIFDNYDDFKMKQGSVMAYPNIVLFRDNEELLFNKPYEEQYFTIQVLEDGVFTVGIPSTSASFKYRLNGDNWVSCAGNSATNSLNAFDILEISCVCDIFRENAFDTTSIKFNAYGNIMSLLYGDKFIGQTDLTGKDSVFRQLFRDSKLLSAENLILPATTLAKGCYDGMFYECTSLTTAPELPATTLANECYYTMFKGCTSLTTAPSILPATTLASDCYQYMFYGCTSLTVAPELPAITLASNCYQHMFYGCTSLTVAPELPATKLESGCYHSMFAGCTGLTEAPELPATTLAGSCYRSMFDGCTSLTTAPELPAMELALNCCQEMFNGCTSLTTAPQLPATTLASRCYGGMFQGCTSLTTAPELPATELTSRCYNGMFSGCTNLNYIKMLATDISASSCLTNWVSGVLDAGVFVKAQGVEIERGTSGIPSRWTVKNYYDGGNEVIDYSYEYFTIEALESGIVGIGIPSSASSLKYRKNDEAWIETSEAIQVSVVANDTIQISCVNNYFNANDCSSIFAISTPFNVKGNIMSLLYGDNFEGQINLSGKDYAFSYLFKNCTTLQSAENLILPATTLASSCYYNMFNNCTSLTVAPQLPATTLAEYCYNEMFYGCTSLETAPELPAITLASNCYNRMFEDCISLTTAPVLPATILAEKCYNGMFMNCVKLSTTPQLPATILVKDCYREMFYYCQSLITAPTLPATTLAEGCYQHMFGYCTSLATVPSLPATTLASNCYNRMFEDCISLNHITMLATDISASGCLNNWVSSNVAPTGTFVKAQGVEIPSGTSGIPEGWDVIDYGITPFTIKALENGLTVSLSRNTSQYRIDNNEWVSLSANTTTPIINSGQIISFKINDPNISTAYGIGTFTISKKCNVYGNIMSLLYGDEFEDKTNLTGKNYAFNNLFSRCTTIINTSGLMLPATALAVSCYQNMFYGCSGLTTAPVLPATTLASNCYSSMFYNCMSLRYTPELLATKLMAYCYQNMFRGCTLLRYAPVLPAKTLDGYCYQNMFYGCKLLTTAPVLPATTLANSCYYGMFQNCTNLNYIKMLATDISASGCLNNWVSGVAPTGTFVKAQGVEIPTASTDNNYSGIPEGWVVQDYNMI